MVRSYLAPFFRANEPIDWEAVYHEQLPRVYNFLRYRVGDDQLAEDLTALTFEKAWRARALYQRDLARVGTWLLTIARNVATDHFRQQRRELSLNAIAQQVPGPALDELVQQRADQLRLARLLTQLSDKERELIALKYGAGLNNREIARTLRLSESNVGTLLHRLVLRLRKQWKEDHDEY